MSYEIRTGERSGKTTIVGPNPQNPEFKESILSRGGSFQDPELAQKICDLLNAEFSDVG